MLEIRNLSKSYGEKKAVCNLNLIVEDGDIMGFIGKNGAGKTTTLKSCLGIVGIDKGEILLDGVSILKEPIVCKKKMAYVPDNPQLDEYMTGIQYLNFIADIYAVPSQNRKYIIEKLASTFQMEPHLNSLISSYSHGMKQKLALIAAFSHAPKLLILDEPFVGLDPEAFIILKEQMKELCADGSSVLFSSHILDVVEKVCNKVAVIKQGHLLYSGPTVEITGTKGLEEVFMEMNSDENFITSIENNLIQLCRLNQLRYADNQKRRNTIYLYIFVGTILIGGLVYLSYSLNIVFSLSWTLDEIIINLILPVILICMILNVFISIFWGSGLLLSDTNIDNLLAFPVPLMVLIISKLSILYLVQAVLDMTLLFPMAVLFGLTADMKISYYPVMAGVVLLFLSFPVFWERLLEQKFIIY